MIWRKKYITHPLKKSLHQSFLKHRCHTQTEKIHPRWGSSGSWLPSLHALPELCLRSEVLITAINHRLFELHSAQGNCIPKKRKIPPQQGKETWYFRAALADAQLRPSRSTSTLQPKPQRWPASPPDLCLPIPAVKGSSSPRWISRLEGTFHQRTFQKVIVP